MLSMPRWPALLLAALAGFAQAERPWKPSRNVEVIVQSAAGSSSDRSARITQNILESLPGFRSVSVNNKPGAGGMRSMYYLNQHAGSAHYIATLSTSAITNHLLGLSPLNFRHFTPLSIVLHEYPVLVTRADSPIASARELMARLQADPSAVSFAYASVRGNHNHVLIGLMVRAAGGDPLHAKAIVYNSSGEAIAAALGGKVDAGVVSPAQVIPLLAAGKIRVLAVAAPQRQDNALAAAPTLREQGINVSHFSWRGFMGAKGLTPAQVAFWDRAFAQMTQTPEWKREIRRYAWTEALMSSAQTLRHLEHETDTLRKLLRELGVAAPGTRT